MNIKGVILNFSASFLLVLVVIAVVTYQWNRVFHGAGVVEWELSFAVAFLFGFLLAALKASERKKKEKE